jgi:hypothetical protein
MNLITRLLRHKKIEDVLVDTEVVYIMLADGTQITIKGLVVVEPKPLSSQLILPAEQLSK